MGYVIKFLKYNNLFPILLMAVFLGSGLTLAASPQTREGLLSSHEMVRSIDNNYLIGADIENYDFRLQINSVTEDDNAYYIVYTYQTIALEDYVWRPVARQKSLTVAKSALGERDLGLFVSEQLSQLMDSEREYFRQAQAIERAKGQTQKVVATEYSGLIGRLLDPKEKVFDGYTPVVEPVETSPLAAASVAIPQEPESERSKSIPPGQTTRPADQNNPTLPAPNNNQQEQQEEIRQQVNALAAASSEAAASPTASSTSAEDSGDSAITGEVVGGDETVTATTTTTSSTTTTDADSPAETPADAATGTDQQPAPADATEDPEVVPPTSDDATAPPANVAPPTEVVTPPTSIESSPAEAAPPAPPSPDTSTPNEPAAPEPPPLSPPAEAAPAS